MQPLRILITNISLSGRSGTETVTRDLALGLVRRGHLPVVYSPLLSTPGQRGVAEEIREALVPVTDDLRTLTEAPDIIHGNHLHETMTACLRFPDTPAIWVCHSWDGPHDKAPNFPTMMKFLAVDESCLERLVSEEGIPKDKTQLLSNCVDLNRFKPRSPLPERPKRALLLSHYAAHSAWFEVVKEACEKLDLQLDAVGAGLGKLSSEPENLLLDYDIVFAVDRTALEATAVGNAVILCGQPGLGPMVKSNICEQLYRQNFGRKWLAEPVTVDGIISRVSEYDAADAQLASELTRKYADSEQYFQNLNLVYEQALSDFKLTGAEGRKSKAFACSSVYIASLSAAVRTHIWGNDEHIQTKIQRDGLAETAERRRLRLERLELERHNAVMQKDQVEIRLGEVLNELNNQQDVCSGLKNDLLRSTALLAESEKQLKAMRESKTMIMKNRILKVLGL